MRPLRTLWLLPSCSVLAQPVPEGTQAQSPQQVIVTGSVVERAIVDAPYAIGVVDAKELRSSGPMINLSESMARVPGLTVNNRYNYAQDLQVSARGFGARTTFGVRGLRLYTDGIPATMPDGQGQVSHFDLADAQRIEVLRGPFSALYGNSSGGVIALFSAPVKQQAAEAALDVGSFGLLQGRASYGTTFGNGWFGRVGAAAMHVDGFRPHSEADRYLASLRGGWQGEHDRIAVQASAWDQPAQDPLGLTREQFEADPDQTAPQAILFDTRKKASQGQLGARWSHRIDTGALREASLMAYGGTRSVTQWQAIPPATQANPNHGGGVIDFDRDYGGGDARLVWRVAGADLVTGLTAETMRDARRGYENFIGSQLGVTGALRRDETNTATSTDGYAQAEFELTPTVGATVGVRGGQLRIRTDDHYLSNGDDSGSLQFNYTNPVVGVRWRPMPALTLHASAARGTESPTLAELAYRPDGQAGLNDMLNAQTSRQFELGAKWRSGALEVDFALFEADVDDEISVATNAGGRSSFRNVGRTVRRGAEVAGTWQLAAAWRAQWALSTLDAYYRDGFLTCTSAPCAVPTVPVAAGNRIAGTQRGSAFAALEWQGGAFGDWGFELRSAARTAVNDINSDFAPGYLVTGLRWQRRWVLNGNVDLELLARIDNLASHRYSGSVIVNEANARYFEPAPPRNGLLALRAVYR
jgi:iron complex outermembrane receptor protein